VEFRILGTLEVVDDDGDVVPISGRQRRELLAMLVVHANHVLSRDRIVEELWTGEPPPKAGGSINTHLSVLRRCVERDDGPRRLLTRPPGYVLCLDEGELDAERFEHALADARRALEQGAVDRAVELYGGALDVWRGPVLQDFADSPWTRPVRTRLEEARLAASEELVDARLRRGEHGPLVGELEQLVAEHPTREPLWRSLMLALYRSGRQPEALQAFQRVRAVLRDEFGVDPSAELVDLERRILEQDDSLLHERAETGPPPTRYARVHESFVAYQSIGDGTRDLLLIPEWVGHVEAQWEQPRIARTLERLCRLGRVLVFDKRGTGLSDPVPIRSLPTLEEWVEDAVAVLDAAGVERAVPVAVGSGGAMALVLAAMHPERVESLVLLGASARIPEADDYDIGIARDFVDAALPYTEEQWGTGDMLRFSAPDEPELREWFARYERLSASPGTALAIQRMVLETDLRWLLPSVEVPTLVLHRARDHLMPVSHGRYLAERLPRATLCELPGSAHLYFLGDPDEWLAPLERFLASRPAATPTAAGLVTLLVVDLVGPASDALFADAPRRSGLLERHTEMARHQIAREGGRVLGDPDGVLAAAFVGPAAAVRGARAVLETMRALGLDARTGVHVGTGDVVTVAHLIAARAAGGEILLSQPAAELVAGSGIELAPRGRVDAPDGRTVPVAVVVQEARPAHGARRGAPPP
jgi:DNA-binding SARP family transcriptional activator/pimeloyl-ACP methyl ester carboxylesterase